MNYFSRTEKILKTCLKERVSITTATIVGFLIAGAVTFATETVPQNPTLKIKAGQENDNQGNYKVSVKGEAKNEVETTFYGTKGILKDLGIIKNTENTVEKGTTIVLDTTGVKKGAIAPSAVSAGDTTSEKMVNQGDIWVIGGGYGEAMGTQGSKAEIVNEGNIYVQGGTPSKSKGMSVNPGGKATNSGNIVVDTGVGMTDNSGSTNKSLINGEKGTITVEGSGVGMYYRKEAVNGENSVENKGKINVTGKGTGVAVIDDKVDNSYYGKKFINSGAIIANGEGSRAIYSLSKNFELDLEKGSHIEGEIALAGANNTVNANKVGDEKVQEELNISSKDTQLKATDSNIKLTGAITSKKEDGTVQLVSGNKEIINAGTISGEMGVATQDSKLYNISAADKFQNDGEIKADNFGIYSNAQIGTYIKEIVNNNKITVNSEKTGNHGIYAAGLAQEGANARTQVINNGNIDVTGEQSVGIRLHENISGTNNGTIIAQGEKAQGVSLTGGANAGILSELYDKYGEFENNGKIEATGDNSVGLLVKHQATMYEGGTLEAKLNATNHQKGTIAVSGAGAVGVKLSSDKKDGVDNKNINIQFVNDGKIELLDGTTNGIGILAEAGSAINNGIIALGVKDTGNIAIKTDGGKAVNNGIVQITDEGLNGVDEATALSKLFVGEDITNNGIIVDKNGDSLYVGSEDTTISGGTTTTDTLDKVADSGDSLTLKGDVTLEAGIENPHLSSDVLNIVGGTTTITSNSNISLDVTKINLDDKGEMKIADGAVLSLNDGDLLKFGEGNSENTAIENNGVLNLNNMNLVGDIAGDNGVINISGETNRVDGAVSGTVNIGSDISTYSKNSDNTTKLAMTSDSKFAQETQKNVGQVVNIGNNGQLVLDLDNDGKNALGNSENVSIQGDSEKGIALNLGEITGEEKIISLGKNRISDTIGITTTLGDDSIYNVTLGNGRDSEILANLTYDKEAYSDNSLLNDISKASANANIGYLSNSKAERAEQLSNLYGNNIYSETARATYDGIRLNEDTLLGLNMKTEAGKWNATGQGMFNKVEHNRTGLLGENLNSTVETSGLMGVMEYGLSDSSSVGMAISGAYQDIDVENGDADGNLVYVGTYAKKVLGDYSLTAGLGYQYGDYDSHNNGGNFGASDSYKSNAVSAYVEGRYSFDAGDNLRIEPKLKLGYTYIDQENVNDSNFRVKDAELSTFNTEIGADFVKTCNIQNGKVDLIFGASYTRAMGDTDKKFSGQFNDSTFDVEGANLSENNGKFDVSLKVTKDSGVFYDGGVYLQVGDDNTRDYGVTLGMGYRF